MLIKALVFLVLLLVSVLLFVQVLRQRLGAIGSASGGFPTDGTGRRLLRVLREVVFQSKVIGNRPLAGLAHALVFWAFLAFVLETLNHFSLAFLPGGILPRSGRFHEAFQSLVALFAYAAGLGILYLAFRRFVLRPRPLGTELSLTSGLVALFIFLLMVTFLAKYHECPVMSSGGKWAEANWWLHSVVLLAFLVLIPRSKHLHLVLSPFAVFFRNEVMGRLLPLDFEKEEMGAGSLADLGKANALAIFSCVECGRCWEHCPAAQTGKALDPKQLVLNLRAGFLEDPEQQAVGGCLPEEWLWQCTTCGACAEQCPTGNDQPLSLLEYRRGLVSEGRFPATFRTLFDNLERSGNPWRYAAQDATAFLEEHDVPFHDGSQKVLYWMGCMARFDEAYRAVALDFLRILKAAEVDFGVLRKEKCTGDAARRAGNEFAFQELAMENAETINEADPELIVSTCPHCIKTLSEYQDLPEELRLKQIPLVHHSVFIQDLIRDGRLRPETGAPGQLEGRLAYHDACYLSRYIGGEVIRAPREVLGACGTSLVEAPRTGRRSFCCGAGGAMLFAEETEGTRVNHERTDELLATGARIFGTSCPFCQTMLRDGAVDKGREEIKVLDIAQIVAAGLPG